MLGWRLSELKCTRVPPAHYSRAISVSMLAFRSNLRTRPPAPAMAVWHFCLQSLAELAVTHTPIAHLTSHFRNRGPSDDITSAILNTSHPPHRTTQSNTPRACSVLLGACSPLRGRRPAVRLCRRSRRRSTVAMPPFRPPPIPYPPLSLPPAQATQICSWMRCSRCPLRPTHRRSKTAGWQWGAAAAGGCWGLRSGGRRPPARASAAPSGGWWSTSARCKQCRWMPRAMQLPQPQPPPPPQHAVVRIVLVAMVGAAGCSPTEQEPPHALRTPHLPPHPPAAEQHLVHCVRRAGSALHDRYLHHPTYHGGARARPALPALRTHGGGGRGRRRRRRQ